MKKERETSRHVTIPGRQKERTVTATVIMWGPAHCAAASVSLERMTIQIIIGGTPAWWAVV